MKAYKVSCDDDGHGATITFAESSKQANRYANAGICDCDYIQISVHHAPAFDKYSPGPVTVRDYLAEGWYWHCGECENHLFGDQDGVIVLDDNHVYCNNACLQTELAWCEDCGPGAHESVLRLAATIKSYLAQRKAK